MSASERGSSIEDHTTTSERLYENETRRGNKIVVTPNETVTNKNGDITNIKTGEISVIKDKKETRAGPKFVPFMGAFFGAMMAVFGLVFTNSALSSPEAPLSALVASAVMLGAGIILLVYGGTNMSVETPPEHHRRVAIGTGDSWTAVYINQEEVSSLVSAIREVNPKVEVTS